jgi:hypothetical protein
MKGSTAETALPFFGTLHDLERKHEAIEGHYSGRVGHAVGSNPCAHRDAMGDFVRYLPDQPLKRLARRTDK